MKKPVRKIPLPRATRRELTHLHLGRAAGASRGDSQAEVCPVDETIPALRR
jgi:hypothetical protein